MACDRRAACEDAAGESSGVATEDELLAGMKQEAQGGLQEIVDERDRGGHDRAAGDGQEGAQAEEKPAVTWVHLRDISVWDMVDAAGRLRCDLLLAFAAHCGIRELRGMCRYALIIIVYTRPCMLYQV